MKAHETNSLHIKLTPGADQLWIECLETLKSDDLKEGLKVALELAKENHVRQWLIDARKIGELSEADETWVQTHFFPHLMERDSTCYIAMVIDNSCYDRMLQESGWFGLKSYNSFIKINTFYNLHDAASWLQSHATNINTTSD